MKFLDRFEPYSEIEMNGVRLPTFSIDKEFYTRLGLDPSISHDDFLRALCRNGLGKRGINQTLPNFDVYMERLEKELGLFEELGYVDYILLIWDIVNYAIEEDIAVGLGRGSAAGSLVLYLIGVTGVDPIKYDLLFERFVSRARAKSTVIDGVTYYEGSLLPDVDVDFEYTNRHKVIEYIQKKYKGKTCKILTVNTLTGKSCIKECAKIAGNYNDNAATKISANVDKVFGKVQHLGEAIEEGLKEWVEQEKGQYQYVDNKTVSEIAQKIEDLPRAFGVHASAMGVSYQPLSECCPVQLTKDGELVSAFTKDDVEQIMVKVDALGLKTLTVLDNISKATGDNFRKIDVEDPALYDAINGWQEFLYGIFQFEGHTALKATLKIKPRDIHHMATINALARPGGISEIDTFAERKNEGKETPSVEENMDAILDRTLGVIAFQEQLMAIAHKTFGFTLEEAEILRRIVGKKKVDQMAEWEEKVKEKCLERGLELSVYEFYWKALNAASNYSFNASHAYSYSILGMQCVYYKNKYPSLFFAEYLKLAKFASNNDGGPQAEIAKIINELGVFNIKIKHPDIIESDIDFTVDKDGTIRYALTSIKGIAEKKITALKDFRGEYPNKFSMFVAAKHSKLTIGNLSALIQAGAMSSMVEDRCLTVLEAQVWNLLTEREVRYMLQYGEKFNYDLFAILKHWVDKEVTEEGNNKRLLKESRYETIKKNSEKFIRIWNLNKRYVNLANWFFERKLLGYSYSGTLYSIMSADVGNLMDMNDFRHESDDAICTYAAVVVDSFNRPSKSGKNMLRMLLADSSATITGILFDKNYDKWASQNLDDKGNPKFPKAESIVVISGKKKGDAVFINEMHLMDERIYLKLGEIKNIKSEEDLDKIEVNVPIMSPERVEKAHKYQDSIDYGKEVEKAFKAACECAGIRFRKSNKKEDIYDHIDAYITLKGVEYGVDVKGMKRINRNGVISDDFTWVEFTNVRGNMGWLYGKASIIAFERTDHFLMVTRGDLLKFVEDKVDFTTVDCSTGEKEPYKMYRRPDRKDTIALISLDDFLHESGAKTKKIPKVEDE